MADLNLDQTKVFRVVGLTVKGKVVPLVAADVVWSTDNGTMSPPDSDGASTFTPDHVGTAIIIVGPSAAPATPGVINTSPVATSLEVEAAPVVSLQVTSDPAV